MKSARLVRKALLFVLATVFLVATCFAQDIAPPVRFTITPGVSTPIYIKTLANGVCELQTDGLTDAAHTLKLFADQEGMVYFNARPRRLLFESFFFRLDDVTPLLLQCTEAVDDKVTSQTYPIELRASYYPNREYPAPSPLPKPVGTIRPALRGDQLNLSDEDLLKAGYPIRPNPEQAPGAYAGWLALVSRPTTVVVPQTVSRPDVRFGPTTQGTSTNWSGFEMLQTYQVTNPNGTGPGQPTPEQYDLVMGAWMVPFVGVGLSEIGHTAAAIWIGLDDDTGIYEPPPSPTCPGCFDLLQDGTTTDEILTASETLAVVSSFAWYENIRGTGSTPPVQDIYPLVQPGDRMFSQVFVANCPSFSGGPPVVSDCGAPNPSNTSALSVVFYIQDETAGWSVPPQVVPINGFSGLTAEWIMERPLGICGDMNLMCDLADYDGLILNGVRFHTELMYWAVAETGPGRWVVWDSGVASSSVDYTMVGCNGPATPTCQANPNDPLSSAKPSSIDPDLIEFDWDWFH
jgi:hypothetical protein